MAPTVAPSDSTQPSSLGPARPVDPAAIESGLAQFWADASAAMPASTATSVVRSCTLNLAIVLSAHDEMAEVATIVGSLTQRHPCRVFVLATDGAADATALDVSVSALCHVSRAGVQHICCEQITITAKGAAIRGLPHLLLAALIPDLPLVVWWRAHPAIDVPLFDELSRIADRTVIDSAESLNAHELPRAAALLDREPPLVLADLAWNRLTRWRTLTAQFFDTAEQCAYLDQLNRITIEVNGDPASAEPLLWLGWLASRLKWTPQAGRRNAQTCAFEFNGRRRVHANIRARTGTESYVIHAITLEVSEPSPARFGLERREAHALHASAQISGRARVSRVVPMPVRETAAILCAELDIVGHDSIYEEALRIAGRLASFVMA